MSKHKISKVYCDWILPVSFKYKKLIEIFVDGWDDLSESKGSIKILYLCEPDEIKHLNKKAIKNKDLFKYIFTHDERVLNNCSNSILFTFGGSWIRNYRFPKKEFGVSTVVGHKKKTKGHKLRLKLWKKQSKISINHDFYLSHLAVKSLRNLNNNPILGNSKNIMFNNQFHIAIENVRKNNWFTEKIIDCFRTKTVPIYWGCPNIADFFDMSGIIATKNLREIISKTNSLTPETYKKMLKGVENNYKLSKQYADLAKRFDKKLEELLD